MSRASLPATSRWLARVHHKLEASVRELARASDREQADEVRQALACCATAQHQIDLLLNDAPRANGHDLEEPINGHSFVLRGVRLLRDDESGPTPSDWAQRVPNYAELVFVAVTTARQLAAQRRRKEPRQ